MKWLGILVVTFCVDITWARYTLAMTAKRPIAAALWSALIILLGGFTITLYTADHVLLIPAAMGAALGTWYAVGTDRDG